MFENTAPNNFATRVAGAGKGNFQLLDTVAVSLQVLISSYKMHFHGRIIMIIDHELYKSSKLQFGKVLRILCLVRLILRATLNLWENTRTIMKEGINMIMQIKRCVKTLPPNWS